MSKAKPSNHKKTESSKQYYKESLKLHKKHNGKIFTGVKVPIKTKKDLALAYTPGIAAVSRAIVEDESNFRNLTSAGKTVAVITDGSAVLGLGNIGPKPAMPVMEGKAVLFKKLANIDAIPITLNTQDTKEIIQTIKNIAPSFAGINLEDIAAPKCFEVEQTLARSLNIPVFHDDQHGTAIVVLAGLINALKIVKKNKENVKVVISGTGAAGVAIGNLLFEYGFKKILFIDSKGIICESRKDLNQVKKGILKKATPNVCGSLSDALVGADVFVGVSAPNLIGEKEVKSMAQNPIIFALSNPEPEIMPDKAIKAGAKVVATGRSDFPNQVNNALVFPGIFKGAFDANVSRITISMKLKAAENIAKLVKKPAPKKILPGVLNKRVVQAVAKAVASEAKK